MTSFSMLGLSLLALASLVNGTPIEQQLDQRGLSAIVCAVVTGIIKEVKNDAKVTSHCSSFLEIPTSTITRTGVTTSTVLSTSTATATVTVPITSFLPEEITLTTTETSVYTSTETLDPSFVVITATRPTVAQVVTSTSTFCPFSSTLRLAKRDADGYITVDPLMWHQKRSMNARATKKSGVEIIKSLQSKVASTVCGCLSIPKPTTTKTALSTAKTTAWNTITAVHSVQQTITVPSPTTKTTTVTTVQVVKGYLTLPPITINVPFEGVPTTTTSTTTIVSTCGAEIVIPTNDARMARSAAKVYARGASNEASSVRFSDKGSIFKLDEEGHLLDENQLIATADFGSDNGVAAVQFQPRGQAKNESMLTCGPGANSLECHVGESANRLVVCLPKGEDHPAMYIGEENYDGECVDAGFEAEVQEL